MDEQMTLLRETVNTPRPFGRLRLCFPAQTDQVSRVRHAVAEHVLHLGWSEDEAEEIMLAVGEACNNAVCYGRTQDGDACVSLTACQTPSGRLLIEIRNLGGHFEPNLDCLRRLPDDTSVHGRGFALMGALMDEVHVFSEGDETVVRLIKKRAA